MACGIRVKPILEVQNASPQSGGAGTGRGKPRLLRGGGYHRPTLFLASSVRASSRPRVTAILLRGAMVCPFMRGIRMSNPCSSNPSANDSSTLPVSSTGTPRKHATIGISAKGKPWSSPSFGSPPPIFPSCAGPHTRMRWWDVLSALVACRDRHCRSQYAGRRRPSPPGSKRVWHSPSRRRPAPDHGMAFETVCYPTDARPTAGSADCSRIGNRRA